MHKEPLANIVQTAEDAVQQLKEAMDKAVAKLSANLPYTPDVRVYDSYIMNRVIERLEEIAEHASLEKSDFGSLNWAFDGYTPEQIVAMKVLFGEKGNPTEFIKSVVKIHHTSWIIMPVEHIVGILKTARRQWEKTYVFQPTPKTAPNKEGTP